MTESQCFKAATDFLKKNIRDLNFGKIAEELGIERHIMDNIRRGSQEPSPFQIKELVKIYPESAQFFADKADVVEEPWVMYNDGRTLQDLVKTQAELIEMQKRELERLRSLVDKLDGENKALKEVLSDRKK